MSYVITFEYTNILRQSTFKGFFGTVENVENHFKLVMKVLI